MGCASPPATSVIAELAARGISRHCRRRPPSAVAGPAVLSPAPTMSPKRCRGADSPSSLGIPRYRLHRRPTWPGLGSAAPVREHDTRGNGGGFAPLEAFCRRVAGVSRLYWCNSPRLVAPSTWGELDRGPLMARIPRLPVVRPRFGAARRPHRRPTRRQTSTTGCRRRGGLRSGYNGALPRAPLARSPLRCEREPAIACANPQYRT